MGNEEGCCCLGFVIYIVAFLVYMVGMASPEWYAADFDLAGAETYTGVFTACYEFPGIGDDCGRIELEDAPDWWQASAGLLVAGLLLGLIAGFTAMYVPVSSALQIVAGGLGGAGSVLYAVKIDENVGTGTFAGLSYDYDFRYGFYLAVIGAGVLFLNGVSMAIVSGCYGCSMRPICCCCSGQRRNPNPYGYGQRPPPGHYPPPQHQMAQYPNKGYPQGGHAYPY